MNVAVLIPVLRRPHRVRPVLESIRDTAPGARVLFIADADDLLEQVALKEAGADWIAPGGNYARKINAGITHTTEALVFTGADDLNFHSGWLQAATAKLKPGIGVVGTNDMCNGRVLKGIHSTHSLAARWYIEEFGTIDEPGRLLHEGYPHEFVDDELVATARHRGMYAHAHDSLVEHMHPDAAKAPMDDLYSARPQRMRLGRRIYRRRSHLWT